MTRIEQKEIAQSPQGSIDTSNVIQNHFYDCGCSGDKAIGGYLIWKNALKSRARIMLIDLRKEGFADLIPHLADQGIQMIELSARSLKFNPLQLPDGVSISAWSPQIAQTLIDVLGLPDRAGKIIQANLQTLYQKYAQDNLSPVLFDLFEAIKADGELNYQAKSAILDSLKPVLMSLGAKVLAHRQGWSTGDLAKHHTCFNLAMVSETDKNLILNSLLLGEFTSRISRGISNPKMDLWICLDEAQRICSGSPEKSAIGNQIGLVRGTGIGLNLSVQSCDGILPQVLSNSAVKLLGRCGSSSDYYTMGKNMGLNSEQIHKCQMTLEPGLFVGQMGQGKWRYPFIFRIPAHEIPTTSKANIMTSDNPLDQVKTVYACEYDHWGQVPELSLDPPPEQSQQIIFDSPQEYRYCRSISDEPMKNSSFYAKAAKVSPKLIKGIRQSLIAKKFIKAHTIEAGGRGRSSILLEVLPNGIEALVNYEQSGGDQCVA